MLVACDFAKQMMELVKEKFDDENWSESYTSVKGNKHHIIGDEVLPLDQHTFDIENVLREQNVSENDRFVFGC